MIRQPADLKNSNIWQQAGKAKKKDATVNSQEKTIIIVGDPGSGRESNKLGKTSFMKILKGDLDFDTKPTCLMQYNYIKKLAVKKQLIHSYEIATKSLTEVIGSLISKENFTQVYLIVCVDLGKPNKIIESLTQWLDILRKQCGSFIKEKMSSINQNRYKQFEYQTNMSLQSHSDRDIINPMPLNTIIIGCKYDILQKQDSENRKWASRCLRYIAHSNHCSLYYSSTKNMQVGAQLRNILHQTFFGDKKSQYTGQKDHMKPIFITKGEDQENSMNLPTSSGSLGKIQMLSRQMESLFGIDTEKKKQPLDLAKYSESKIDALLAQKKKEIAKIAKTMRNNEAANKKIV